MADENLTANNATLSGCVKAAIKRGYVDRFRIVNKELAIEGKIKSYVPDKIKITHFYLFEGYNNPDDSSIIYYIETEDGKKGTLIDAYGVYADTEISNFIQQVDNIHK